MYYYYIYMYTQGVWGEWQYVHRSVPPWRAARTGPPEITCRGAVRGRLCGGKERRYNIEMIQTSIIQLINACMHLL